MFGSHKSINEWIGVSSKNIPLDNRKNTADAENLSKSATETSKNQQNMG